MVPCTGGGTRNEGSNFQSKIIEFHAIFKAWFF